MIIKIIEKNVDKDSLLWDGRPLEDTHLNRSCTIDMVRVTFTKEDHERVRKSLEESLSNEQKKD